MLVMLRWVLIIATSYLVIFNHSVERNPTAVGLFVASFFASNILLTELAPYVRSPLLLGGGLVLFDSGMVVTGFLLSGAPSSEFFVMYFLVLFLTALTDRIGLVVVAALLVSVAHLYSESLVIGVRVLQPEYLLRVPFLFVVAMFFGHLVQEARRRERRLRAARARGRRMDILSEISHDLKNPLGVIHSLASLLLDDEAGPLNPPQRDLVRRIHASTQHVITLALNVIDEARIEAGRLVLHRAYVGIRELVQDALLLGGSAAELKGVSLSCVVQDGLPLAEVDAVQLQRVVANVVGNAIKFTPAGGRVNVAVRRCGDDIDLTVEDTGPGIPSAELPRLFERYRRRAGRVDGSGLGLFIARAIVEAHGGSLRVESTMGRGTTVRITVPLERPEDPASSAVSRLPAAKRRPSLAAPEPADACDQPWAGVASRAVPDPPVV
jgi:signal transduction histidine kinase